MAWKIGLTFFVPFVVATFSGAAAIRRHNAEQHPQPEKHGIAEREPG